MWLCDPCTNGVAVSRRLPANSLSENQKNKITFILTTLKVVKSKTGVAELHDTLKVEVEFLKKSSFCGFRVQKK